MIRCMLLTHPNQLCKSNISRNVSTFRCYYRELFTSFKAVFSRCLRGIAVAAMWFVANADVLEQTIRSHYPDTVENWKTEKGLFFLESRYPVGVFLRGRKFLVKIFKSLKLIWGTDLITCLTVTVQGSFGGRADLAGQKVGHCVTIEHMTGYSTSTILEVADLIVAYLWDHQCWF